MHLERAAKELEQTRRNLTQFEQEQEDAATALQERRKSVFKILDDNGFAADAATLILCENRAIEAQEDLKSGRRDEQAAKAQFTLSVEQAAHEYGAQGGDPYGRTIHPNANIVHQTIIRFPTGVPAAMGRAITWLCQKGQGDTITIKTHGSLKWYQAHRLADEDMPEDIQLLDLLRVRVDGREKWPGLSQRAAAQEADSHSSS